MTDLRHHIDLIERAQAEPLHEASPFRHALAGALAAGVALGATKTGVDDPIAPPSIAAPAEPDRTRPEPPRSVLAPTPATIRPKARPSALRTPDPEPRHDPPRLGADAAHAALDSDGEPIRPKPRPVSHKRAFVQDMVPRIEQENMAILAARRNIERLMRQTSLTPKQRAYADRYMSYYKVKDPDDFAALLARMNVIPPSLVLAQAALESGWGRSRLARQGNALFGQKTTGNRSVAALGDGTRYAAFDSRTDSVRSYMRNLNTHPAYKDFRAARNRMVADGEAPSGLALARHLEAYSTKGAGYVEEVKDMIRANHFDRHDQPPEPPEAARR